MKRITMVVLIYLLVSLRGLLGIIYGQNSIEHNEPKLVGQKIHIYSVNAIGSTFLNEEWLIGDILLYTGRWVKNVQLKYNLFSDQLVWLRPSDYAMVLIEKEQIVEFNLKENDNHTISRFRKMNFNRTLPDQKFYEVMYDGNYTLYCQRRVITDEDAVRKANYSTYSIPIMKRAPIYVISLGTGKLITFEKISNRSLIRSFKDDKELINFFLNDFSIKIRNENDLIKFVREFEKTRLDSEVKSFQTY